MLYEVRDQTFQPDVIRSGMLSSPMPPSELPREVPEHSEAIQSESSENSADERRTAMPPMRSVLSMLSRLGS